MRIINNHKEQSKELKVGEVVKGNNSGDLYLIIRQGVDMFNAVNLRNHRTLSQKGYATLNDGMFIASFRKDFKVPEDKVSIVLGEMK